MIQRVSLHNFKAFERFTLDMKGDAYLAGPNNAGKSTLIAAMRLAADLLAIATRRNPTETFSDQKQQVLGYVLPNQTTLGEANLRHEFRDVETRLTVRFRGGGVVVAVWPTASSDEPFFYLQQGRSSINNIHQARDAFPDVGVIPVLSPVDDQEELLTTKYVRENLDGRLASRHFRNQLLLLQREARRDEGIDALLDFALPWLPEIKIRGLSRHQGERNSILDLYYVEPGRRSEKEIVWAGDGIQIWLQLLLHVFRLRNADVVVLDEPDVFLDPDLQRRLVRLLSSLSGQTVTATHSSEVLVEAPPEALVWIDKSRKRAVAGPSASVLGELSSAMGSGFSIRLARALRARCALFVEGDDAKILRQLARATGAARVATETGIVVIPLKGFDNWAHVEPFSWMSESLLENSVRIFVLLDRDYRTEAQCREIQRKLRELSVKCHVWKRKEIESYLLEADPIARLSGADAAVVEEMLAAAADDNETYVFGQVMVEALRRLPRDHQAQAAAEARETFDALWLNRATRKWVVPPSSVLHGMNRRLTASGYQPTSFGAIANEMWATEVPHEMANFLDLVEEALDEANVPSAVR